MKTERKTVYVEHPVTPEQKSKLLSSGYKILDAKFAPLGEGIYWFDESGELLSTDGTVNSGESNDDELERKRDLIDALKEKGINRDMRTGIDKLESLLAEAE